MIYFIRHSESEANLKGVFAGQKDDSPLTETGKEQARATAQSIKAEGFVIDKIVSSPLKRTMETAEIIAREIGFDPSKIEIDNRATEYDMGSLTGTPLHKISSVALTTAENAEDPELFRDRVEACIKECANYPGNVLLVSSAGVGRMVEIIKNKGQANLFYDLPAYLNASITKLDWLDSDKKSTPYSDFIKAKHERLFNTEQSVIDEVVQKVTGLRVKSQEKLFKGEANEVYSIVAESGQEVIVRISHHKTPRFKPERWALDECRKLGIPVPEVLLIENREEGEKKIEICVESKLPGIPVKEIRERLSDAELKDILHNAGEILSRINSIKVEGFGDLDENGKGEYKTIQEVVEMGYLNIGEMEKIADQIGLDKEIIKKAFHIVQNADLSHITESRLIHNDFAPKHILVADNKITGILDFETVEGGDPAREFARWMFFFGSVWPIEYIKEGYTDKTLFSGDFDQRVKIWKVYFGLGSLNYYVTEGNQVGIDLSKDRLTSDVASF